MAVEDAEVLVKCLRDIPDVQQAFTTYEHLCWERTTKIYELGVNGDKGKHIVEPLQVWFRDLTTSIFLRLFTNEKATSWVYSYRIDWEEKQEVTASASN